MVNIWDHVFYNNTLRDWAICLAIIAISLIALRVARKVILKKIKTLAAGTKTTIDDFFCCNGGSFSHALVIRAGLLLWFKIHKRLAKG
jgi:hypothetical protein